MDWGIGVKGLEDDRAGCVGLMDGGGEEGRESSLRRWIGTCLFGLEEMAVSVRKGLGIDRMEQDFGGYGFCVSVCLVSWGWVAFLLAAKREMQEEY